MLTIILDFHVVDQASIGAGVSIRCPNRFVASVINHHVSIILHPVLCYNQDNAMEEGVLGKEEV